MKVLFWIDCFWPQVGGMEIWSRQLISALKMRGYEFAVVTSRSNSSFQEEESFEGISIHRFNFDEGLKGNLETFKKILRGVIEIKKSFRPDIFHINSVGANIFYHYQTLSAHSAPNLVTLHQFSSNKRDSNGLEAKKFRTANWVTAVSQALLQDALSYAPQIKPRSSVIFNALNRPKKAPRALPFDPPVLLFLGRLIRGKGADVALDAFARLLPRFPNLQFLLAGTGPEESSLKEMVKTLGVENQVKFFGLVPPTEIADLMNQSTLVLIPSRIPEAFGLVALEAAHMRRPVIATRVGGLPEVVVHGETGLLVEKDDRKGMVEAIAYLLLNPSVAEGMGDSAYQRAQNKFCFEKMADEFDNLYGSLKNSENSDREKSVVL